MNAAASSRLARMTGLVALLVLAGCAAGPNRHEPNLSFLLAIDNDSEEGLAKLRAEFESRCPDNAEPDLDNLEVAINVPTLACAELRSLLAMADAFGMVPTSGQRHRAIVEELMASFEDELDRRCD